MRREAEKPISNWIAEEHPTPRRIFSGHTTRVEQTSPKPPKRIQVDGKIYKVVSLEAADISEHRLRLMQEKGRII